jgi:hypothetical protein
VQGSLEERLGQRDTYAPEELRACTARSRRARDTWTSRPLPVTANGQEAAGDSDLTELGSRQSFYAWEWNSNSTV